MKLVTYESTTGPALGVLQGDVVVDVSEALDWGGLLPKPEPALRAAIEKLEAAGGPPLDMIDLISRDRNYITALGQVAAAAAAAAAPDPGLVTPLAQVRLRAPIAGPPKIACVGLNYADHAREQGKEPPKIPVFFQKSSHTVIGPGDPIRLPVNSNENDCEAELAIVIGKGGTRISAERAWEHVAGYTILNDVSARDMQRDDRQWWRGKSCDTFGPTGPWIVTPDEIPDPHALAISLTLNGQTMQDSNTSNLIHRIDFLISYLSQSLTWETGDLIATGTPGGVGVFRKPPIYIKPGDEVSITVQRIGSLTNPVAAA